MGTFFIPNGNKCWVSGVVSVASILGYSCEKGSLGWGDERQARHNLGGLELWGAPTFGSYCAVLCF
jgi:hypothetical protein